MPVLSSAQGSPQNLKRECRGRSASAGESEGCPLTNQCLHLFQKAEQRDSDAQPGRRIDATAQRHS